MKISKINSLGDALIAQDVLKAYLRVENDAENALIEGFYRGAIAYVEGQTGLLLERGIYEEKGHLSRETDGVISLCGRPMHRVERVVQGESEGSAVLDGPIVRIRGMTEGPVTVTYEAGFGRELIPGDIYQAILMATAHFYEERGEGQVDVLNGRIAPLLAPYRRVRLG